MQCNLGKFPQQFSLSCCFLFSLFLFFSLSNLFRGMGGGGGREGGKEERISFYIFPYQCSILIKEIAKSFF